MNQLTTKKVYLLCLLLLLSTLIHGQTAKWAFGAGGNASDGYNFIARDPQSNIITVGSHQGGFTIGNTNMTLFTNFANDIVLTKHDSAGNLLWVRQYYGPDQDHVKKLLCDKAGNIYIAGSFTDSIQIGHIRLIRQTIINDVDGFIAKIDPNGNTCWAITIRSICCLNDLVSSIGLSNDNKHLYATGFLRSTLSSGNQSISPGNGLEAYLIKFDTSGNIVKMAAVPGYIQDLSIDTGENIYLLGTHNSAIGAPAFSNLSGAGVFVTKLDSALSPSFSKYVFTPSASNTNYNGIALVQRILLDRQNNIYITSIINTSVTLHNTALSFTNTSTNPNPGQWWDGLLVKLNSSGNASRGLQFKGDNHDVLKSVYIDPYDSLWACGWYYSSNFNVGNYTFSNSGENDGFIMSMDTAFNLGRKLTIGGNSQDYIAELIVDSLMSLYAAGGSSYNVSLGNNVSVSNVNKWNLLLAKYQVPNPPVPACSLTVNLGPDTGYCNSFSRVLAIANPPAGTSFLWSTNDTTPAITVNQPGSYWVRASHPLCLKSDTIQISVDQTLPSYTSLHDTTLCHTQPIYLSRPTNNARFTRWWNNSSANTVIAAPTLNHAWIEYKNYCGTIRDSMRITRTQPATLNLGPDTTLCSYQHIILQAANPGYRYLWSTGDSSQTIQATNAATYWVEVSNYCGAVRDSITISKLPNPTVYLGADTFICGNGSVTLHSQASYASSLLWSNNAGSSSISVQQPGQYVLTAYNRCASSSDSIYVSKLPVPQVSISGNNYVCKGAQTSLQALANEKVIWSTLDSTNTIIIQQPGKYWVSSANRCGTASDSIQVDARHAPEPRLGNDSTFCNHINITLYANTAASYYTWSSGAKGNNVIGIPVFTPGWYWVDASNICGTARDSMLITKGTLPVVNLGNDTLVKPGFSITLDAGSTGQKYRWSRSVADTLRFLTTSSSGIYWVDVSNICGTKRDSIHIMLNTDSRQPGAPFQFSVFPNPGSHEIKLSTHKGAQLQSLSVVDIMGRTLLHLQNPDASSGLISLDVSGLANGNYWLHIVHSEGLSIIRFSIDR